MNLGTLRNLAAAKVPEAAVENREIAALITDILNEATLDIASKLNLLHENVTFNVEANKSSYIITDIADDFLRIDSTGLYWNSGTSSVPVWGTELVATTRDKMDKSHLGWRDDDAGDPARYYLESNIIKIHPTPDTDLTNGFWLYYIAKPQVMSEDTHFPFKTSLEIPQYTVFNDTILKYWAWKAYESLGKQEEAMKALGEYKEDLTFKMAQYNQRLDLS